MSRKPRPKTKRQVRKMVEEIVLTEEDEKVLDKVWDEMRRELIERRKRKEREERMKKAKQILELARENPELRNAILKEKKGD